MGGAGLDAVDPEGRVRPRPVVAGHVQSAARVELLGPATAAETPEGRPGETGRVQKKLTTTLAELATAHPGETIEVWFEDEARFGQKGTLTTVWADTGSRPTAPKQGGFQSLHVLTAVCPGTGRAEGLISPRLDTGVTQTFLDQLAATVPAGTHVALIWDNAGYHTAKRLRVPPAITVVPLPPYSPELNPVENLWHYLKSHHWSNRAHDDYDAMLDAAQDAWTRVCSIPERIKSICAAPYLAGGW